MPRGNPDNLRRAAQRKHAAALQRAEQGLAELARSGQPVTFRGVARAAGVSLDFLYGTPEIRGRIEALRQQRSSPHTAPPAGAAESTSSVVRTLTLQLTEARRRHRQEVQVLQDALAAAHGELLALRRQLGARAVRAAGDRDPAGQSADS